MTREGFYEWIGRPAGTLRFCWHQACATAGLGLGLCSPGERWRSCKGEAGAPPITASHSLWGET